MPHATGLYVISPSSAIADPAAADRAAAHLAQAGYRVRFDSSARARSQRFAGTDAQRSAAFTRAAKAREPIVMTSRGGYGLTRILDRLDFQALADSGKQWVGLSDFTAFHLAMLARAGATTWAGPALLEDFATERFEDIDPTTLGSFDDAMSGRLEMLGFHCDGPGGLEASGTLWGGNLSVLTSLMGTPWMPRVRGGILYLEDVNEHPYRVERMLTQLLHSGILDRQRAVLLGYFNRYRLFDSDQGFDLAGVIRRLRGLTRTPILTGLPFGHDAPKLTLPHGAKVSLAVERKTCWLVLPHRHGASHAH